LVPPRYQSPFVGVGGTRHPAAVVDVVLVVMVVVEGVVDVEVVVTDELAVIPIG